MVLPHRVKAAPEVPAEQAGRAAGEPRRRLGRGRRLEEEWRFPWDSPDGEPEPLDLRALDRGVGPTGHITGELPALAPAPPEHLPVPPTSLRPPPVPPANSRDGVVNFRRAAVGLALSGPGEGTRAGARECATSLMALAAGGHEQELAQILQADPAAAEATWTVACYQIGDLSPTALRDFAEAAPAVIHLSGCETASHVAAELIVTNGDGVRWTALVRSGSDVLYQPVAPATATAGTAATLLAVRHRWEDQLLLWSAQPDAGLDPPVREAAPLAPAGPAAGPAAGGDPAVVGLVLGQMLESVRQLESRLPAPAPASSDADRRFGERLAVLETTTAGMDALRSELARLGAVVAEMQRRLDRAEEDAAVTRERVAALEAELRRASAPPPPAGAAESPVVARPPGFAAVVAHWALDRFTHWSDGRYGENHPASPASRRIQLQPAEQWPDCRG